MAEQISKDETPKFVSGSIMWHIFVMTATASIGLVSIFIVDFANLFYISLLGKQELAAAIGYAGTILFFNISICIGIMISAIALVSRALGRGDREKARVLSGSSLIFVLISTAFFAAIFFPFIEPTLEILGARGETKNIATGFLQIVVPSMPFLGLGMCAAGLLRAVGDAKRAMYGTLGGGVVAALLDPLFIFTFDLGVYGAAYVTVISRLAIVAIGFYGIFKVHDMVDWPSASVFFADAKALLDIAVPAVLTNVATPVGNAYVTGSIAPYGDEAVAGWAIIGRLIPVAFGFVFALSGAIGPIVGQNFGAGRFDRVERTITDSLLLTAVYTGVVWLIVFVLRDPIITGFNASGDAAALVAFFINFLTGLFVFNAALFVANAAFNNLGYATYSTVLNWGKATIGTVPFVWAGAVLWDAKGVLLGQAIGSIVFGVIAVIICLRVVRTVSDLGPGAPTSPPLWRSALSAFSSGKGANLS